MLGFQGGQGGGLGDSLQRGGQSQVKLRTGLGPTGLDPNGLELGR